MENPYKAPETNVYDELGEDIITSPNSETKEESPLQKLSGRGIYTSFLFCVLISASLLRGNSNLPLLAIAVALLIISSVTYIVLSVREK